MGKIAQFGSLFIDDTGFIFNAEKNREIKQFHDKNGHLKFVSPDTKKGYRTDHIMAMLFLNNGKPFKSISDFYIEHIDGDNSNCNLSNLKLYRGKEAHDKRFGYLKQYIPNRGGVAKTVYIADIDNCDVLELTLVEAGKLLNMNPTTVSQKAKQGGSTVVDKRSKRIRYYIEDNMLDAWTDLP